MYRQLRCGQYTASQVGLDRRMDISWRLQFGVSFLTHFLVFFQGNRFINHLVELFVLFKAGDHTILMQEDEQSAIHSNTRNLLDGLQVDSHDQRRLLCHQASYCTFCECFDTFFQHCLLGNHNEQFLYQAKILKFRQIPFMSLVYEGYHK